MTSYVLALDQGTTSTRAILFDRKGEPKFTAQIELPQSYPKPGWVEHDPEFIWNTTLAAGREAMAMAGISATNVEAIGISNQRETTLVWDRQTGTPIYPAIVWQDRRTTDICAQLRNRTDFEPASTGLVIDPYFSATKIQWILANVPGAAARAKAGELAFGTVDSFLIWRLTRGLTHVTDITNASRTLVYAIDEFKWSDPLLQALEIPKEVMPSVVPSSGIVGETDPAWFGAPIPIAGIAGDQQASLFGQACFRAGMAKNTYGTGCFLLRHTGPVNVRSSNRLLSTPVAGLADQAAEYASEGSVFMAGAAIQWLRDELAILGKASDSGKIAASIPDSAGVHVVPGFVGLGAPYWDAAARGAILGLSRGSNRKHIIRATLESIAYQTRDVVEAMDRDFLTQTAGDEKCAVNAATDLRELRVDGGAAKNDFLMQFQADILGIPVVRSHVSETTAQGAAFLAGLAVGFWSGQPEIEALWRADRLFEPRFSREKRDELYAGWLSAVARTR